MSQVRVRVKATAIWRGFKLYECLLVNTAVKSGECVCELV